MKYPKKIIDTTIGSSILPVGMGAIRGEGQLGQATSMVMLAGHTKKTAKRFGW